MPLSLAEELIFAILAALVIIAYALGKSVASTEDEPRFGTATFWIFISSIWLIGPVVYLVFRRQRPLLARRCLQQCAIVFIATIAMAVIRDRLDSVPGLL